MKVRFLFRHQWLLVAAAFFVSGFFIGALDIALHDTYIVVSGLHVGIAGALFFGVLWALHRIEVFRTIHWLSFVHLIGTSLSGLVLLLLTGNAGNPAPPQRYYDYSVYNEFHDPGMDLQVFSLAICLFVLLQACWLIQLVAWLLKRR